MACAATSTIGLTSRGLIQGMRRDIARWRDRTRLIQGMRRDIAHWRDRTRLIQGTRRDIAHWRDRTRLDPRHAPRHRPLA
jgi:hypothetical protein